MLGTTETSTLKDPSAARSTSVPPDDFPQIPKETNRGRHERGKVVGPCQEEMLRPGWAGTLTDDELEFIIMELRRRPGLAKRWGFRPTQGITPEAVRRVAMCGDAANLSLNRQVARPWFGKRRD